MRYGIVSDVHANIQAWKAVLRDMKKEGVDSILCLGDVIGYGPNPAEVLDSCYEHVDYFILGNHDAVIGNRLDSNLFNDNAKFLIEWTREQLSDSAADFFAEMPLRMEGDGFICAHGELAMPGRFNYIYEAQDAIESFTSTQSPLMFVGHTHFPAKFRFDLSTNLVHKDLCTNGFLLPHERYLINAGSVGDPRDGNTTASYCIYDADTRYLTYKQVPFDVQKFRRSLHKAQLPIQPYFLSVYEGKANESETIKDMRVMESNQAAEIEDSIQMIDRGSDAKTSRQKITFSLDDVRSSRKSKEEKLRKQKSETESKKKGLKIFMFLALILLLSAGGLFVWLKMQQESAPEVKPQTVKNEISDKLKEEMKEAVIIQEDSEDLVLDLNSLKNKDDFLIEDGELKNWQNDSDQLLWNVRIKQKGWYKVLIDHSKANGESQIEVKLGAIAFASYLSESSGVQEVGLFENLQSGQMIFSLSLASSVNTDATSLKSVRLKYVGEEKPFDYATENIVLGNFESGTYEGWIATAGAFGNKPISENSLPEGVEIKGLRGQYAASSIFYRTDAKGSIRTPLFEVKHKLLCMLVAGGKDCSINLFVDGQLAESISFSKMGPLTKKFINLKPYAGKQAYLEFFDNGKEFLVFDNVILSSEGESAYTPGESKTISGKKQSASENKLNKYLSKAGGKIIKKDFKGSLRDLEEAAVITSTDMSTYINAINAISDLEKLFIGSFEKDLKKSTSIKSKATGGSTSVTVDSIKDNKVFVKVGDSNTLTPLRMAHISEAGIVERLSEVPDGLLAYHIHNESIKEQFTSLKFNSQSPIGILVTAALGGIKINYPKGAIVGSSIEIWALESSEKATWSLAVKTGEGEEVFAKAEEVKITDIKSDYKAKGLTKAVFDVYKYDLTTEKQILEASFKQTRGELTSMVFLIRNSRGKIVWQKGYNENTSAKNNLLKAGELKFFLKNSQPPHWDNLALNKPHSSSDPHSGGYVGINDGIWSFTPPFVFASSKKENFPKYVTIDLEKETKINALRFGIPNRGSTRIISLQYSLDNNEYKTIMDFDFTLGQSDRYTAFFKAVNARYIRVRFNRNFKETLNRADNSHVFLSELEAYYLD